MRFFDIHTDILHDLNSHFPKQRERFLNYHLPQLQKSSLRGGIWTLYSPQDFNLLKALNNALSGIVWEELPDFDIVLGLEGLRNLRIEDLEEVYQLGFRHAMLTWNEENIYATGVSGSKDRGLTSEGKKLLRKMEGLDMIIDLAHLNEKSFDDVLDFTDKNIIFSHGNLREFCDVSRNLSKRQLKRLREADGLLGLTLVGGFISLEQTKQNLDNFLVHLEAAIDIMGIDNIAFGFDFMDYFDGGNFNIEEIPDASVLSKLVEVLEKRGFSEEDLKKISYENFYRRYQDKIIGRCKNESYNC